MKVFSLESEQGTWNLDFNPENSRVLGANNSIAKKG